MDRSCFRDLNAVASKHQLALESVNRKFARNFGFCVLDHQPRPLVVDRIRDVVANVNAVDDARIRNLAAEILNTPGAFEEE